MNTNPLSRIAGVDRHKTSQISNEENKVEKNLEEIFDNMVEGCQIIGFDFRYLYVNKAVAKQGRSTKEKLLGHTMMEMYPGIEKTNVFSHIKRCMVERVMLNMETEFFFPDGSSGWFELRMEPVSEGILIFSIDITERKAIDRAKTEFVAIASHALRTPLGISKWYLEALEKEGYLDKAPKSVREYFAEIHRNNERLLALVRNLLSISRIDKGQVKDSPQMIEVIAFVQKTINDMQTLALKKNIALSIKVQQKKKQYIKIDSLRLQEVIENLISNAILYNVPYGKVDIIIDKKSKNLFVHIKDTGIGIQEDDKKKIFTRFFRSEKAMTLNTEGSGLGLYLAKAYIEGWGGSIAVESKEGQGSMFSFFIPC